VKKGGWAMEKVIETALSAQYLVDQRSISDLQCKYPMRRFSSAHLEKALAQPDGITLILMQI
jgi:hypothetical protein